MLANCVTSLTWLVKLIGQRKKKIAYRAGLSSGFVLLFIFIFFVPNLTAKLWSTKLNHCECGKTPTCECYGSMAVFRDVILCVKKKKKENLLLKTFNIVCVKAAPLAKMSWSVWITGLILILSACREIELLRILCDYKSHKGTKKSGKIALLNLPHNPEFQSHLFS